MAPRQKTFELIPNAPAGLHSLAQQQPAQVHSKPPMTTKQVKKLHRQANKGPKLSKAEQRRIELMEQDRIRKEFEKERAQARARTARDRKKAKEEKEKEERRRRGLPLVNVHPSQDTISRFVRPVGKRTDSTGRDARLDMVQDDNNETATEVESGADAGDEGEEADEDGQGSVSDEETQDLVDDLEVERKAKKPRLSQSGETTHERLESRARPHPVGTVAKIAQELRVASYSRASSVDTDDPINETLLENQLIADLVLASSRNVANRGSAKKSPSAEPMLPRAPSPSATSAASKVPPRPRSLVPKPQYPRRTNLPAKTDNPPPDAGSTSHVRSHLGDDPFKKPVSPYVPAMRPRPSIRSPAFRVQSAPPKFKPSAAHHNIYPSERPRFLPKHLQTPQQRQPSPNHGSSRQTPAGLSAPSSTQMFLLDHVDDLFPSPSQAAQELAEDLPIKDDSVSTTKPRNKSNAFDNPTDPLSVCTPCLGIESIIPLPRPLVLSTETPLDLPFCTQELLISSQDIRDIETPSKVLEPPTPRALHRDGPEPRMSTGVPRCVGAPAASIQGPHSQRDRPYASAGVNRSSHQARDCDKENREPQATFGPPFPNEQCSLAKQPRSTPRPSSTDTAVREAGSKTTSQTSPPKKRMFGSSGPGAEALVAMERSYQQSRREQRAREAAVRAEERQVQTAQNIAAQTNLELVKLAEDDSPDDDLSSFTQADSMRPLDNLPSKQKLQASPKQDHMPKGDACTATDHQDTGCKASPRASQETDYGDFEFDAEAALNLLEGDTRWLDDGLDNCI